MRTSNGDFFVILHAIKLFVDKAYAQYTRRYQESADRQPAGILGQLCVASFGNRLDQRAGTALLSCVRLPSVPAVHLHVHARRGDAHLHEHVHALDVWHRDGELLGPEEVLLLLLSVWCGGRNLPGAGTTRPTLPPGPGAVGGLHGRRHPAGGTGQPADAQPVDHRGGVGGHLCRAARLRHELPQREDVHHSHPLPHQGEVDYHRFHRHRAVLRHRDKQRRRGPSGPSGRHALRLYPHQVLAEPSLPGR